MDFTHTKLQLNRSPFSYSKMQFVIAALIRNRSIFLNRHSIRRKEYLDIGCGPNTHREFINLDFSWRPGVNVCWNVTKGIPLEDESLSGIFSEHCLEHLTLEETDGVLRECLRLLRAGGTLRIVVPDGELYLEGYTSLIHGNGSQLPYAERDSYEGLYSPILSVNRIFRHHGHLFIYDFEMLRLLLQRNGFVNISKERFSMGRDPQLLIDSTHRKCESLYIEASKPTA